MRFGRVRQSSAFYLHGVQGVPSSNLGAPTNKYALELERPPKGGFFVRDTIGDTPCAAPTVGALYVLRLRELCRMPGHAELWNIIKPT